MHDVYVMVLNFSVIFHFGVFYFFLILVFE